jgi:hypothetical protein
LPLFGILETPQCFEGSVLMKTTFVDLKNPDLYRHGIPHEVFTRLRREAPIAWNPEDDGRGFWADLLADDVRWIVIGSTSFGDLHQQPGFLAGTAKRGVARLPLPGFADISAITKRSTTPTETGASAPHEV